MATLVFEFDAVRWLLRLFLGPKTSLQILAFEEVSEKEDHLEERGSKSRVQVSYHCKHIGG